MLLNFVHFCEILHISLCYIRMLYPPNSPHSFQPRRFLFLRIFLTKDMHIIRIFLTKDMHIIRIFLTKDMHIIRIFLTKDMHIIRIFLTKGMHIIRIFFYCFQFFIGHHVCLTDTTNVQPKEFC